ncbi:2-phosphosulfolactate phosphatase [Streptomyces sp. NPDC001691]|uniref:2-phosphosulfolactate phosphatase n=1 Tax=Streptomyces sp. NPDC001691 TaxID=3364600 RepID=UPI00368A2C45
MSDWYSQGEHGVRFEWGLTGAQRLAPNVSCLVVVDVLSFTTSVTVAVESGARVFPYAWRDETAFAFARHQAAELAVGRRETTSTSPWSLSPAALRKAPYTPRLVLPSPNGSTIAAEAGDATVVAGCLRNAMAVGRWLALHGYGGPERPVGVIAAGERWPDGSLRPALEDAYGAGAIIAELCRQGARSLSPEAVAVRTSFCDTLDVVDAVTNCSSGRELVQEGFSDDVAVATELDAASVVPVLINGAFASSS